MKRGSKRLTAALIRACDVTLASAGLIASAPILTVLAVVGYFDTGSPFFAQVRVGRNQRPFTLYKLRTMRVGTEEVATHLARRSDVTRHGAFLRRTKLDELPQLVNVIRGDMSLVGPRPGLTTQTELTAARRKHGLYAVRPGITGLGQVSGVDMSTPEKLAALDAQMIEHFSLANYGRYLILTLLGRGAGDRVRN